MNTLIYTIGLGLFCMLAEILNLRKILIPVILIGLSVIFYINLSGWDINAPVTLAGMDMMHMMRVDKYAMGFSALAIFISAMIFMMSYDYYKNEQHYISDYLTVMVFALVGALVLFSYWNLAMLFLGIEILSISMYIMAGSRKYDTRSNEAGFKYFLMGAFASGFLLFGIALIYGASGSFELGKIADYVNMGNATPMFYTGLILMMVAFFFKASAVPFHFWSPDVYQGAPALITAMMSTLVKVAVFGAFYRIMSVSFFSAFNEYSFILALVTIATLFLGNLTALAQDNFKRMLAYSGISHAGYMLLAILSLQLDASSPLLFYSIAYSIASIGAFAIAIPVFFFMKKESIDAFNGLGKKNPFLAAALTVFMLSLAGIPPLAGFLGKYYIFSKAMERGLTTLTVIAVINSIIGIYYYLKVVVAMYTQPADDIKPEPTPLYWAVIVTSLLLTILLGIYPGGLLSLL